MRKYLGQGKKKKSQGKDSEGGKEVTNIRNGKFADQKTKNTSQGRFVFFQEKDMEGIRGVTTQK